MGIFFGILTIGLVLYLIVRVAGTSTKQLLRNLSPAEERKSTSKPLGISQITTLGIIVVGGILTLDHIPGLIFSLGTLRQRGMDGVYFFGYIAIIVQLLALVTYAMMILFAPAVSRWVSPRSSSDSDDRPPDQNWLKMVLVLFAGWILLTNLPALFVGGVEFSGTVMTLFRGLMQEGGHLPIFEFIGTEELQFVKIVVLVGIATVVIIYRERLSYLLECWYGVIRGHERT